MAAVATPYPVNWWVQRDPVDEWERFVTAHAGLLSLHRVWFPSGRADVDRPWPCTRCQAQMAIAVIEPGTGVYYYWCRCGNHDKAQAGEYNALHRRKRGETHRVRAKS